MENGRPDRIEAALLRLTEVTEAGFSGATEMLRTTNNRMMWLEGQMNNRMMVLEGQMTEAIGRLRIIGDQLATHSHSNGT